MNKKLITFSLISAILSPLFANAEEFQMLTVKPLAETSVAAVSVTPQVSENMLETPVSGLPEAETTRLTVDPQTATTQNTSCTYEPQVKPKYDASLVSYRQKLKVEPGEVFRTKVFVKNTGNMPWFSNKSPCNEPHMKLGTEAPRDHQSILFTKSTSEVATNWESSGRVLMDQYRVDPGEIASFTFWSEAPQEQDILRYYFRPVIDGVQWIENDDSEVEIDLIVGETSEDWDTIRKRMLYASQSGSLMDIDFNAEKVLRVDISDQTVDLMLGDYRVRQFPVSTGAAKTPTPLGEFRIKFKQEVRVGHQYPHYVMPKFMWFRDGGYGFHALPSLRNDGGTFWREAFDHIQQRVSHGCIRLLPDDANFIYDFTDVGTRVSIKW